MKPSLRERARGVPDGWARFRLRAAQSRVNARGAPAPPLPPPAAEHGESDPIEVNCIIFSKDRAMQLDACLRSIERNAPYAGQIAVIYLSTSPAFAEGYRRLHSADRVRLVPQSDDFRRDVNGVLDHDSEFTVFHTDDDIFFCRPPAVPVLSQGFAAFSLRLGENTTRAYTLDRPQKVPPIASNGSVISWDWTRAEGDFSYPMSLNGHVLHTDLLLRMLRSTRFANPNGLEAALHRRRYLAPPRMLAFRESCLVSIPANLVNATHRNRTTGNPAWSAAALNARFLAGDQIASERMDFSSVRAAHQEVPFVFGDHAE